MKALRNYTPARVELGLSGASLPTQPLLDLRLAQARAQDAVHLPLDSFSLAQELRERKWASSVLRSTARDRTEYLQRPDKGRLLETASVELVRSTQPRSFALVIADGLSALAVHRHAIALLSAAFIRGLNPNEAIPLWIVHQGRVAIGDHIGELLRAELSVVLIGERPGLSTPDSLGMYLTWNPRVGRQDSERNCISNIHSQGLTYQSAAEKLVFLTREARRRQISGVHLKDTSAKLLG